MVQLLLPWPSPASYAEEDFIMSAGNACALGLARDWPANDDAAPAALIHGPASSGKTHLASLWATRTGGVFLDGRRLGQVDSQTFLGCSSAAVIEQLETITDEAALFHLLRHAETHDARLLLTSAVGPGALGFRLADLTSRLRALPQAGLLPPDDAAMQLFISKLFSDFQLVVAPHVVRYLCLRTERDYHSARKLVGAIAQASAQRKARITLSFVKRFLT